MSTISPWTASSRRKGSCTGEEGDPTEIDGVEILDTYAEGFSLWFSRVIITAETRSWAEKAATEATGFATSKIGCPCEAGIEGYLSRKETPDGRPGVAILIAAEKKNLKVNVASRISQCILPAPTASAFDGLPDAPSRFYIRLHYFGDTYEERCTVGGRRCWRIPIMEGTYVGEERYGCVKGIAGGNFLVMGEDRASALSASETAVDAIGKVKGVTTSFAGGIVSSGSKPGCRNYRFPMPASTNHPWCPTLRGRVPDSSVPEGIETIYEIVINGLDEAAIRAAMKVGILAAIRAGGVRSIGASNFMGRLGEYRFSLHDILK